MFIFYTFTFHLMSYKYIAGLLNWICFFISICFCSKTYSTIEKIIWLDVSLKCLLSNIFKTTRVTLIIINISSQMLIWVLEYHDLTHLVERQPGCQFWYHCSCRVSKTATWLQQAVRQLGRIIVVSPKNLWYVYVYVICIT